MARVPTGQQSVGKTPLPTPRTSRAKPPRPHRLRANQHRSSTTIINLEMCVLGVAGDRIARYFDAERSIA